MQGHPEFTPSIVSHIVDARSANGIFDQSATVEARRRLGGKDGSGGEGFGRVGWAIWRVLLHDSADLGMQAQDYLKDAGRYKDIDRVLDRRGPWTAEDFVGGATVSDTGLNELTAKVKSVLRSQIKILVIGAGGLGCEILQNLALSKSTCTAQ